MRVPEKSARDGALVFGGGGHGALAVVRSLGRHGIPVWIAPDELRVASSSRYVRFSLRWPPSLSSQQKAAYLVDIARRSHLEGWALIAGNGAAAELMALHRELLASVFQMATSSAEAVCDALDKRRTYALAARSGVDHPLTRYPRNAEELGRIEIAFPAILKPAVKVGWNAFIKAKAWKVRDRDELLRRYREALTMIEPGAIMLQDLIPGSNENQYSYAALCRDGTPIASLVARRLRQYPVEFGRSSSLVETIDLPEVEKAAGRVLGAMGFTGIVEVEFKRDPRDGRLKLLDINPRAWRWMSLGHRAGIDFPYLLYRLCRGEAIDRVRGIAGVRWVRMATDPIAAAIEIRRGLTTPRAYLKSLRPPIEFAVFARDDPMPALLEVPHLIASELRRFRTSSRAR